ncbi:MAG: agmatinase family protein [Candidatus Kaiserbacteria bacterium]|nr:MAG: agmatinase family protein [Candidatus Kaiserbacteria bacterium]
MGWKDFDPQGVGLENSGIFGLPFTPEEAQVVLIPAPWGVTVSYGGGTEKGPEAILDASPQIDFFHDSYGSDSWKLGISMLPLSEWKDAHEEGLALRKLAEKHIASLSASKGDAAPAEINERCRNFHERIERTADDLLAKGKLVGLIGGDHSTPLGLMRALAKKHEFGILQIDAHCDLRDSYEGFTYSHASIMHNALHTSQITRLTQVGVRDYSIGERAVIEASGGRIQTFFDADLKKRQFEGERWSESVAAILATLPEKVYLSFDIDGLDPALCPHTGTPVPGGLQFDEAIYLIRAVAESGRTIIGFDVNEVSPSETSEWDANVGMRVLWNLAMWSAKSNNMKPLA